MVFDGFQGLKRDLDIILQFEKKNSNIPIL